MVLLFRFIDCIPLNIQVRPLGKAVVDDGEQVLEVSGVPRMKDYLDRASISRSERFTGPGNIHTGTTRHNLRYGQQRISHIDIPELENHRRILMIGEGTYVVLLGTTNLKLSLGP